mmetsp:Transcript_37971/g.46318  ORF Transcript_37971/g.46318 Transcript_37971/m.46318 type:complete len:157 (+) Transcript_37971:937-1407(+)
MEDVPMVWHRTCSHMQSGECDKNCSWCRFSFPEDEPLGLESDWAKCRCFEDRKMSYGHPCTCFDDMYACGSACKNCNKSWPADDADRWWSSDAMCRCVPNDKGTITFGDHQCKENHSGICGWNCKDCRWSWPEADPATNKSDKAMCRCADSLDFDQ